MINMDNNENITKKYNLEEAVKRLQKINEYTFYDSTMAEADDDQSNQQGGNNQDAMGGDPNGGIPPMDNGQGGGDPNAIGNNPNGDGMQPIDNRQSGDIPQDDNSMMSYDPNAIGDDYNMMGDDGIEDIEMDTEQPGDEVIDVDELTQSQETTEFKVDHVDDKLNKVLKVISKFNDAIEANDKKIEDLKKEFEKRNPTAEETMNLRSLASYPFSEKPEVYWRKQQEEHPNYRIMSDNDIPTSEEQKEFEIRKSDIDNFNERDIMKSLGENHLKLCDFLQF